MRGIGKAFFVFVLTFIVLSYVGCAMQTDHDKLEKRVAALEARVQGLEAQNIEREQNILAKQADLKSCVDQAEADYWKFINLNGTKKANGNTEAPIHVWTQAREDRSAKISECRLLYGR